MRDELLEECKAFGIQNITKPSVWTALDNVYLPYDICAPSSEDANGKAMGEDVGDDDQDHMDSAAHGYDVGNDGNVVSGHVVYEEPGSRGNQMDVEWSHSDSDFD